MTRQEPAYTGWSTQTILDPVEQRDVREAIMFTALRRAGTFLAVNAWVEVLSASWKENSVLPASAEADKTK